MAARFLCPECGSGLRFDPATEALLCPACQFTTALPEGEPPPLHDYANWESLAREEAFGERTLEAECPSCGARVEFSPPLASTRCAFCTSELIGQPHDAGPLLTPDTVLPFRVPADDVRRMLDDVVGGKTAVRITDIRSIYLPFWVFTAKAAVEFTREEAGATSAGRHQEEYWDIGVPAVKTAIPDEALRTIGEFPWAESVLYHPGFLAGHEALRYQRELPEGLEGLKATLTKRLKNRVEATYGLGRYPRFEVSVAGTRFQHMLAPVWIGAYRHRGKVYQFVVNGANGTYYVDREPDRWLMAGCGVLLALFLAFFWWVDS